MIFSRTRSDYRFRGRIITLFCCWWSWFGCCCCCRTRQNKSFEEGSKTASTLAMPGGARLARIFRRCCRIRNRSNDTYAIRFYNGLIMEMSITISANTLCTGRVVFFWYKVKPSAVVIRYAKCLKSTHLLNERITNCLPLYGAGA